MVITFSPFSACKSLTVKAIGAYRLFVLLHTLAGSLDHASLSEAQAIACRYVTPRTFKRWLRAAVGLGLVSIHERKNGDTVAVLVSRSRAAVLLDATPSSADHKNTRQCSLDELFSDNWQAIAFTTWQEVVTRNGLLLWSQKKLAERTGISPQMQREYNKSQGIVSRSNYAVSNIQANQIDMVKEFDARAGAFIFKDNKTKTWYIAWRLPSSRVRVVCGHSSVPNASGIGDSEIPANPNAPRGSNLFVYDREASISKMLYGIPQRDLYVFDRVSKSGHGMYLHYYRQ